MAPTRSDLPLREPEARRLLHYHLGLLRSKPAEHHLQEMQGARTAPIFTMPVREHVIENLADGAAETFAQYGLIAGVSDRLRREPAEGESNDPRIFFNVTSPSSTFICGSQGSGKSHTLSCMLENCLSSSDASVLPNPLTGIVFHYDAFISDGMGSPCEAAFLSSNPQIKVRVLCSPANIRTIQVSYQNLINVKIEPLRISQKSLNTKRMLDLMAVNTEDGSMPLYLHAVYRILREMRIEQQAAGTKFDYLSFKQRLQDTAMTPAQLAPLHQRLDTLESFMPSEETSAGSPFARRKLNNLVQTGGNDWTPEPGCLTIVDLSCPCVTPEGACSLFNICLSIFLEQTSAVGRVVALDEAHKYMNTSTEASTLTNTLLSAVRMQRHLGVRIIVSTQEPTISPALLDLSSVTIVHRFTSPEWLRVLKCHLAGAAARITQSGDKDPDDPCYLNSNGENALLDEIVNLNVGEALMFGPSALVGIGTRNDGKLVLTRLGGNYMKIQVRARLTTDGGGSVMAA